MNVHFEENWEKTKFESDHVLNLRGAEIPYHTVCEDNFFYDEEGKAVATIYSYAYFRSDVQDAIRSLGDAFRETAAELIERNTRNMA